jgi:hypothetical protein
MRIRDQTRVRPDHARPSTFAQVAAWFVALLVPTLLLKYVYIWALSGRSLVSVPVLVAGGEPTTFWWLFATSLAPADVMDVALITGALLLAGHLMLRVSIRWVACASVFIAVVVCGASALSLHETSSLIDAETLRVSLNMSTNQPDLIWEVVTWRGIAFAGLGAAWTLSPLVLARAFARLEMSALRLVCYGVLVILVALAALALRQFVGSLAGSEVPSLSRGFWESATFALLGSKEANARIATVRESGEINAAFAQLAYPHGHADQPNPILDVPLASRRPRHVLILLLETAPQKFYPLADSEELPTFRSMSGRAVVNTRHYAAAPLSNLAVYSVTSGTYPRPGTPISQSGRFATDGLPALLTSRGYESTFIDSWSLSWNGPHDSRSVSDLGFGSVLDAGSVPHRYADCMAQEIKSMTLALDAVLGAERRGRKAFVVVATHIGHYRWIVPDEAENLPAPAKLMTTAKLFDTLMAGFLDSLAAHGLSDEIIIVVTGDHGLRFNFEFASLGEPLQYGDMMFNVPFLMYAPALFPAQLRLPFVTSHVDIAPTLLDLTGTPRNGRIHHGGNMLDRRLADRITFMSSGHLLGLYPLDEFHLKSEFYAVSRVLNRVTVRNDGSSSERAIGDDRIDGLSASQAGKIIAESRQIFDETAEVFLRRGQMTRKPAGWLD